MASENTDQTAVELGEAHQSGCASAAWCLSGVTWSVLSAGQDARLCTRQGPDLSVQKNTENSEGAGFTALAVSPNGKQAATADKAYVKLWSLPGLGLGGAATRFTLPARALAWSPDGTQLAAGADDMNIKIVRTKDTKVLRQLRGEDMVRSLAWDPEGTFLAASLAQGTMAVWQVESGQQEMRKRLGPKVDPNTGRRLSVAWHPDGGSLLAVPGMEQDIVLLERLSWEPASYLTGGHNADVDVMAFSPSGIYLASADTAGTLAIWLVDSSTVVNTYKLSQAPTSLQWHPKENSLLVGGEKGGVKVLVGVVPAGKGLSPPTVSLDDILKQEDKEGADPSAAGLEDSFIDQEVSDGGDDDADAEGLHRIRRRAPANSKEADGGLGFPSAAAAAAAGDGLDGFDEALLDDGLDFGGGGDWGKSKRMKVSAAGGASSRPVERQPKLPKVQKAIQPGSTPSAAELAGADGATSGGAGAAAGARFLAYTMEGCVISRPVDNHHTVEVLFHDMFKHRTRVPLLTDYYGFTAAALGDKGVLYSSPPTSEAPAMLVYRPFDPWAANSEWMVQLPEGETAVAVAAGSSYVAVATNRRLLRLYSLAGRALGLLSLGTPVVALSGQGDQLGVVAAAGNAFWEDSTQLLQYQVLDVSRQSQVCSGPLPLSPGASLTWLAFSKEGLLATADSSGMLRIRTPEWGGAWTPVLDKAAAAAAKGMEAFWPVSLSVKELVCVSTTAAAPYPTVVPRPVLSTVPLSVPLAPADFAPEGLEGDGLREGMLLAQLRQQAAAAEAESGPGAAEEAATQVLTAEFEADRLLLRQLQAALKANRQARALEIVGCLSQTRSIEGALKLANHFHMTLLAERITAFLEQRLAWEEQQQRQQGVEEAAGAFGGTGSFGEGPAGATWSLGRGAGGANGLGEEAGAPEDAEPTEVVEVTDVVDEGGQGAGKPLAEVGNTASSKGAVGARPVASIFKKQAVKAAVGSSGTGAGVHQGVKRKPDIGSAFGSGGSGATGGKVNPFTRQKVKK